MAHAPIVEELLGCVGGDLGSPIRSEFFTDAVCYKYAMSPSAPFFTCSTTGQLLYLSTSSTKLLPLNVR